MAELHPKSIRLMQRVAERFEDDEYMTALFERLVTEFESFIFLTPREDLKHKLLEKMTKGALEHGEPTYSVNQVAKEKEEEMLDIIGWDFTMEEV